MKKILSTILILNLVFCFGTKQELIQKDKKFQGFGFAQNGNKLEILGLANKTFVEFALDKPFVIAEIGNEKVKENLASYHFSDSISDSCDEQSINQIKSTNKEMEIIGTLKGNFCDTNYSLKINFISPKEIQFNLTFSNKKINRSNLIFLSDKSEQFFGLGEQFTHANLKKTNPFLFTEEQGIGRGDQPITFGANLTEGAGGNEYTSYAPIPHYISTKNISVLFENTTYSKFDFKDENSVKITFWENGLKGTIWQGSSPYELIELYTSKTGRNPELPDWAYGTWLGAQGGEISVPAFQGNELKKYEKLEKIISDAEKAGNPITALWIQDWCGRRITGFGDQLKWRWYADDEMYPDLKSFIQKMNQRNIKVLGYINSFLADKNEKLKGDKFSNPQLEEAKQKGYLVKNQLGEDYRIRTVGFPAYLIDLTNPEAFKWTKEIIKKNMIEIGLSGWMADFGEWLPYDAKMFNGETGKSYHNKYPVEWARLNREAISEAKKDGQIVFFSRAGYTNSNKYSTAFWAGDQMVTLQEQDGLASTVVALTSSGISGLAINHSDIGGYTTILNPAMLGKYKRTRETLFRWIEMNAFTPIYRTHEGNKPKPNIQAYTDEETIKFFAKFGKIHFALKDYLKSLMQEAKTKGYPFVRATYLNYPNDPNTYDLKFQFMLGTEILVLPVVVSGDDKVKGYFPEGDWQHLFTSEVVKGGKFLEVNAPIGTPAVYVKKGTSWSEKIISSVNEALRK